MRAPFSKKTKHLREEAWAHMKTHLPFHLATSGKTIFLVIISFHLQTQCSQAVTGHVCAADLTLAGVIAIPIRRVWEI